jgi:hypothetical protein
MVYASHGLELTVCLLPYHRRKWATFSEEVQNSREAGRGRDRIVEIVSKGDGEGGGELS